MAFFLAENPREFVSGYQYNARKIAFFCDFYIEIYEMEMDQPGQSRAEQECNKVKPYAPC